jgi:hypothetical protein
VCDSWAWQPWLVFGRIIGSWNPAQPSRGDTLDQPPTPYSCTTLLEQKVAQGCTPPGQMATMLQYTHCDDSMAMCIMRCLISGETVRCTCTAASHLCALICNSILSR